MSRKFLPFTHTSHHAHPQTGGFTLIEVLASIIMATVFVLITSQAIAISALYRIRAQRKSEALQLIQENFANIKFAAIQVLPTANCNATTPLDGYAATLAQAVVESGTVVNWSLTNSYVIEPANWETVPNVEILNRDYSSVRTLSFYNDPPYHVMEVSYSVVDITNPDPDTRVLATFYTEVLPDAALACSQ